MKTFGKSEELRVKSEEFATAERVKNYDQRIFTLGG